MWYLVAHQLFDNKINDLKIFLSIDYEDYGVTKLIDRHLFAKTNDSAQSESRCGQTQQKQQFPGVLGEFRAGASFSTG